MSPEANDTARKVCDAMVAEHVTRAEYFNPGKFTNTGSRTLCGWSGTTEMSCPAVMVRTGCLTAESWARCVRGLRGEQQNGGAKSHSVAPARTGYPSSLPLPRTPSTPSTTERRTSTVPSASSGTSLTPAHQGGGYTKLMEGFCCIEGFVENSEQLSAAVQVRVVGLPQSQEHQVGCQGCAAPLGLWRPRLRPSLLMQINVHRHICISFLCCTNARDTAQHHPSTPRSNLLEMRRTFETRISLPVVFTFVLCAQSVAACSSDSQETMVVKKPSSFPFFLVEPLVTLRAHFDQKVQLNQVEAW